ncbi:hypothetical protein D3C78_1371470 [compost metagenome]
MQQVLAFGPDLFPVGLQRAQVRELRRAQERPVGQFRAQVKQAIDRCEKRRMIAQLAADLMPHPPAQMNVANGENVNRNNDELHGNRHNAGVNRLLSRASQAAREVASSEMAF